MTGGGLLPATTRGLDEDPALEQPGTVAAVLCSRWEVTPNFFS